MENFDLLLQKIDAFIRKYYFNQLLKGFVLTISVIAAYFLIINLIEHYFFLSTTGRKILFYSFLIIGGGITYQWILSPLFHYFKLGKIISHAKAAQIIGSHFPEVADKLMNVLQLKQQLTNQDNSNLLMASIHQKSENLKPIPFLTAIDLKENKKYLKFAIIPLFTILGLLFASPDIIRDSSTRLLFNNTVFEKPSPFQFEIQNTSLKANQYQDFELILKVTGNVLPNEVYVNDKSYAYKMQKRNNNTFVHTFSNVQKTIPFYFSANGFSSNTFQLIVVPKPLISKFEATLLYPAYTNKSNEIINNIGDFSIPIGTKVQWKFFTKNTTQMEIFFADTTFTVQNMESQIFNFEKTFLTNTNYKLKVSGEEESAPDSVLYTIQVIPDQHPSIYLQTFLDSTNSQFIYFSGDIADDYGLSKLLLKFQTKENNTKYNEAYSFINIPIKRGVKQTSYEYYWDVKKLNLPQGAQLNYFLEVWDNDAIHGSKFSRTANFVLEKPTREEQNKLTDKSNEKIKDKLSETIQKAAELKKDLKDIKSRMLEKKNLNWEDKKAIEEALQKQQSLDNDLQDLQKELAQNKSLQNEKSGRSEEIIKKQETLEKMFNEIMSDEMKKMYEQLESLLEQMKDKEALDKMEDLKLSEEQLEKELDRMLSLFKSLEFEQKMQDAIEDLKKLAEEQNKLSQETQNADKNEQEKLAQKQEDINNKFDAVKKNLEDLKQIAQEAQQNPDFSKSDELSQEISEQLNESQKNISQGKNKKAGQSQKNASDKMSEMSQEMSAMLNDMQMEQMEEDLQALRQLLENLLHLSIYQEDLMEQVSAVNINDPKFLTLIQEQKKIKDDSKMVEDSLFALSKRVFQLETFVNKEIAEINKFQKNALENLEARQKISASRDEQLIMTGYNNLALMLSEALEQMQQQMASQMPGSQMCQKNDGKKPGSKPKSGLGDMQKQLNDQINQLQKEMKSGKSPGKGQMSKEMAEMAQKQAAIKDKLKKLMEQEGGKDKDGEKGLGGNLQKLMDQMDKTETEIANKKITNELMLRQQEILTKLLETEESLRNREKDNKRESVSGQQLENKMPPSLSEYLKKRDAEIERYKTVPPSLKPFYKDLVEKYFKQINF